MDPNRLIHYGLGTDIDLSDFMRKSVYDANNDNVVDKLNKITDITELQSPIEGDVPKHIGGVTRWAEDESGDGGAIGGTV